MFKYRRAVHERSLREEPVATHRPGASAVVPASLRRTQGCSPRFCVGFGPPPPLPSLAVLWERGRSVVVPRPILFLTGGCPPGFAWASVGWQRRIPSPWWDAPAHAVPPPGPGGSIPPSPPMPVVPGRSR